ncbi:sensor histidine kinase [Actinocorallia longicatena]|uniref:histidine kinase n=1 Tax=Actinocorallia longicatena TaxID=111803 RepID=A0ABP6QDP5_9ACTN
MRTPEALRAPLRRLVERRAELFDVALAVVATAVEFGLVDSLRVPPIALTAAAGAALLLRRRHPMPVLAVTIAAAWACAALGEYPGGAPVLVALYTIAEERERRVSVVTAVPVAVFLQAASISSVPVTVGAWALGSYVQTRRRYVAALEERAAQLEREREQLDRIAARDERTAIARELHDIVAHSVTVMLLGVRGARDILPTEPAIAADTLRRVETTAEDSLAELRRMLTVLRDPARDAQLRPQPSLARLDALISGYRDTGMPLTLTVTGERRPLPGGIELSVYRIIEEALTNVLKHARPARVDVTLAFTPETLTVTIDDDGPSRPATPGGHGLTGMRERVIALGGDLTTGPRTGGGFTVTAALPIGNP